MLDPIYSHFCEVFHHLYKRKSIDSLLDRRIEDVLPQSFRLLSDKWIGRFLKWDQYRQNFTWRNLIFLFCIHLRLNILFSVLRLAKYIYRFSDWKLNRPGRLSCWTYRRHNNRICRKRFYPRDQSIRFDERNAMMESVFLQLMGTLKINWVID